jgi:protein-L-isoaspartate(D-aspartate) O-methyltransferase
VKQNDSMRRERLVRDLATKGIRDRSVLEAIRQVPRELFVQEALRGEAYRDASLPIGEKQTISQPWIVARMTELAEPNGTGKVLEVGTGSGYQAAVLSHVFELVYSVERIRSLSIGARRALREFGAQNVHLKIFDGSYGWSEFAPYRAILVTAAAPSMPATLVDQLEEGGRLIVPIGPADGNSEQVLTRFTKKGTEVVQEEHGTCRFVPLLGRFGWNG